MVDGIDGADGAAFAQTLSALKDRGSNLLVVGTALQGAHANVCDRLLGDGLDHPRRRVFVRTDGTAGCAAGPRASSPEPARLVTRSTATRGVAAASSVASVPTREITDPDVEALAAAVDGAVTELQPQDGFEPAQLRVCFDSLLPLLADQELRTVSGMLDRVTDRVHAVDGMGHYHLPVARDEETVAALEPLFDAVIDLRVRGRTVEQNWALVDQDVESGWLPV